MISSARVQATGAEAIRSQPMWVSQRDDQPREPEIELQDDITNYLAYGRTTSLKGGRQMAKVLSSSHQRTTAKFKRDE